jgi:uncharacterized cupin superfamily protein
MMPVPGIVATFLIQLAQRAAPAYVLTLSGPLEFAARDGKASVLRPGDVLVAADDSGVVTNGG